MKIKVITTETIDEFYKLVEEDVLEMRDLSYPWGGASKMCLNGTQLYRGNIWWCDGFNGSCKVRIFKVTEENVYNKEM